MAASMDGAPEQRTKLLLEALAAATVAGARTPASLAVAALRASLAVSLVIESSSSAPPALGASPPPDLRSACADAAAACDAALAAPRGAPEPVIVLSGPGGQRTCDPCCLRVQERAAAMAASGEWGALAAARARVVRSVRGVLRSCAALLADDATGGTGAAVAVAEVAVDAPALAAAVAAAAAAPVRVATAAATTMPPPPPPTPLSIDVGWDAAAARANPKRGAAGRRARPAPRGGPPDPATLRARHADVAPHWATLTPAVRAAALRVPVAAVLDGAAADGGVVAAAELEYALQLLRCGGGVSAAYWRCALCPAPGGGARRFASGAAFLDHVDACHEDVQLAPDGGPAACAGCGLEVVGAHYAAAAGGGGGGGAGAAPPSPITSYICLPCHAAGAAPDAAGAVRVDRAAPADWSDSESDGGGGGRGSSEASSSAGCACGDAACEEEEGGKSPHRHSAPTPSAAAATLAAARGAAAAAAAPGATTAGDLAARLAPALSRAGGVMLEAAISRAGGAAGGAAAADPSAPGALEAALAALAPGDLQLLLNSILTSMPPAADGEAGTRGGIPPPLLDAAGPLAAPLFDFASPEDAAALEAACDAVFAARGVPGEGGGATAPPPRPRLTPPPAPALSSSPGGTTTWSPATAAAAARAGCCAGSMVASRTRPRATRPRAPTRRAGVRRPRPPSSPATTTWRTPGATCTG